MCSWCRILRVGLSLAFLAIAGGIALGLAVWGAAHLALVALGAVALVAALLIPAAVACDRQRQRATASRPRATRPLHAGRGGH